MSMAEDIIDARLDHAEAVHEVQVSSRRIVVLRALLASAAQRQSAATQQIRRSQARMLKLAFGDQAQYVTRVDVELRIPHAPGANLEPADGDPEERLLGQPRPFLAPALRDPLPYSDFLDRLVDG